MQYVFINCALNTSQRVQAGASAPHLARAKPVARWEASQNTGDSTLLQLQTSTELASEIYKTPCMKSLSIRNGCLTSKSRYEGTRCSRRCHLSDCLLAPQESPGCTRSRFPPHGSRSRLTGHCKRSISAFGCCFSCPTSRSLLAETRILSFGSTGIVFTAPRMELLIHWLDALTTFVLDIYHNHSSL